jgi:elongation factor P
LARDNRYSARNSASGLGSGQLLALGSRPGALALASHSALPLQPRNQGIILQEITVAKINASDVRKGNVLDVDGKLCVVLKAESIRPGKGTPTTTIDMRNIQTGIKSVQTYKTTEALERAFVEERYYNYLYEDDMGFNFMEPETFEQLAVPKDVVGDQAIWLQENMQVTLLLHEGVPLSIELPARVILEIVEADPVVKGQTASSSFKPAKLSNGARVMVPPHIGSGTRVVVMTADGSYVERAKD